MVRVQHTLRRCLDLGLDEFLLALGPTSAIHAPSAFELRFCTSWANASIQTSPSLALFAGVRRQEQVERFRSLDQSIRRSALDTIKAAAAAPARRIASAHSDPRYVSEVAILRRELEKRRHIKPLRKLFADIPHALQALKPCMLMSPISVSTFLRPDAFSFDLVIFDEASQLPTPEAIPSVIRAGQAVVAGDANQLPPTSFFDSSIILDEERAADDSAEELEPLESLLDDCVAIAPTFERAHLNWHYRSRDERLIKFSNHYFYDNMLTTFPAASTSGEDRGVRLEYVPDGIWDRGRSRTNRQEARRVAQLVVQHLEHYPDRSLGVVALNVNQREAIEESLEEILSARLDLAPLLDPSRSEPFFIKALENVQGDERDTMIISVGYTKAADGSLSLNFGPLNQEGGWRRLNVLITRARWHTILVTSMRGHDLAGVNPNNRGAVALWNFISYCERSGELPAPIAGPVGGETNDFEDAVAEALRERGFDVNQQVGASAYRIDLAIRDPRNPHRYVLGIECDGATYHSAKTARDRDLLRQEVLREQGWRLHRVWSTDWFRDREKALKNLLLSVEFALKSPTEESVPAAPPIPPLEVTGSSLLTSGRSDPGTPTKENNRPTDRSYLSGEPYRKCREVGAHCGRECLLSSRLVGRLSQQIVAIVRVEGPIHEDLLAERLKEVNSVERVGANIQANIRRGIDFALRTGAIERSGGYLQGKGHQLKAFRVPGEGVVRPLGVISTEEIELAILYLIDDQFGFQREALPQAVSRCFGLERVRAGNAELVGNLVDALIERGMLRLSGPNVYIADPSKA